MKQYLLNKAQEYMALAFSYSCIEDWDTVDSLLDKADFIVRLVEEYEEQEENN